MLVGGCGAGGDSADLASLVPPDAPLYVEANLSPDSDQAAAVAAITERVAGISDPRAPVIEALDRSFADAGLDLSYADDVEPWLGDRAAAFVRSFESSRVADGIPDFAALLAVDDADAARDFVHRAGESAPGTDEQRSYAGFEYDYHVAPREPGVAIGIVDDVLVLGTEPAFKVAVDASEGESLADSQEFVDRTGALPEARLATLYLEPTAVLQAQLAARDMHGGGVHVLKPLLAEFTQPVAAALSATPGSVSIDFAAMIDTPAAATRESPLLGDLPGGSWLALAVPRLGTLLGRTFDELSNSGRPGSGSLERTIRELSGLELRGDAFDWLGDGAGYVQGTGVPGFEAGVIAQTDDPAAARPFLRGAQVLAERQTGLRSSGPPQGADYGFSLGLPGLGGGLEAGVVGGRVVAVVGGTIEQALEPDQTLDEDDRFGAATESLGAGLAPALYVFLPTFFEVAAQGDHDGGPDYRALAPYLGAFETLVAGSMRDEDGVTVGRATVTLAGQ